MRSCMAGEVVLPVQFSNRILGDLKVFRYLSLKKLHQPFIHYSTSRSGFKILFEIIRFLFLRKDNR
jgi:hypothetical protein